ncbi:protein TALPID3 isoform X2 [Rhinatrema bivittatum]|uniref:protein TALPID3 isoform X2 n=1 Tax=Rhinatrema bivittatum TaxID=194408 RepID=UPI00112A2911|nr:protein TALPID3 isoform X2 [Rhinatrema bivittatum]
MSRNGVEAESCYLDSDSEPEPSSTTSQVLIRSTCARPGAGLPGGSGKRRPEALSPAPCPAHRKPKPQESCSPPPALAANRPPADILNVSERNLEQVCLSEHNMDMPFSSQKVHLLNISKDFHLHNGEANRRQEVSDICISHYTIGQKEALRAVLKQRTQNTLVNKEVSVQLLEDVARENSESATLEKGHAQTALDSAAAVAAVTAAAIASSAPLFKAQNELEAKINSVSGLLSKLEETDKQLQRITEQKTRTRSPALERPRYDRVSELEKHLNQLTEQRLQHLEKLQQQQLDIQSHFLSSAINLGNFQASGAPVACAAKQALLQVPPSSSRSTSVHPRDFTAVSAPALHAHPSQSGVGTGKSPLETPAPRRFAPIPMSKDGSVSQKEKLAVGKENVEESKHASNLEKGRFLDEILRYQETPTSQRAEKAPVSKTKLGKSQRKDSFEPTAAPEGSLHGMKPMGSSSIPAVQKADDVLRDLGQLKKEMHSMLQPKEPVRMSAFSDADHISKPTLLQTVKAPKSMFEDAERILCEVRNNKKVLEDNLEAIIRAKDGAAMYSLINALSTNRDAAEEIRIQKTVDAWITAISTEIQDEMARKDYEKKKLNQKDHESSVMRKAQSTKGIKVNKARKGQQTPNKTGPVARKSCPQGTARETATRSSVKTDSRCQPLQKRERKSKVPPLIPEGALPNEEFLSQLYGKAIYQGHRSTLKKGPYLRFNSPSPKSKLQRPRLIESVKGRYPPCGWTDLAGFKERKLTGVKVKSARTQTGSFPQQMIGRSPPMQYPLLVPLQQDPQYVFSLNNPNMSGPMEGHLIPMAIPLGRSQFDDVAPHPAAVLVTRPQPITVTTSIPPTAPKPQLTVKKPNVAVVEMKSEKKEPPKLAVQVLPNVDIDSVGSDSASLSERSLSPVVRLPPPAPEETVLQTPEPGQHEEECTEFPGTDFVDVTDIAQYQEKEDEIPEPVLELNGWSEPVSAPYSGLPFPPTVSAPQPTADLLDGIIKKKETLENRLISWVEQEIMAQIINGMFPVQSKTMPNAGTSDGEESVVSDIVEAAGGGGLQLFVNAGVPVDSDLIRQYVNEALAETVAILLGDREAQKRAPMPRVPESAPDVQATVIHTPVATPPSTPPHSPLKEPALVKTPVLSPQNSEPESDGLEQRSPAEGSKIPEATSPVVTPAPTPVATPPRVTTPTPPVSEHVSDDAYTPSPERPNPWGDAELPLEEENPTSAREDEPLPRAVVMSVARDDEAVSLISRASPVPEGSLVSPSPVPQAPSPVPVPSPSSTSSAQRSSSTETVTETDTPDRPISEGEVLYSYGQMVAARALAEGGLPFDQLRDSLSSTLQDAHEMDYDPPSEGQVVRRPHKGYHRDPVLSVLAQLKQTPIAAQEVLYHAESSEDDRSVGEMSEGQRPRLTTEAESIMVGHSIYMSEPRPAQSRSSRVASPGQLERPTGAGLRDSDASHGPMSIGELELQPAPIPYPTQINAIRSRTATDEGLSQRHGIVLVEPKSEPIKSIQMGMEAEVTQQQGSPGDLDRTLIEPNAYLTLLLSGLPADPNVRSLPAPGRMTVTLPSVNTEKHAGNIGSLQDDTDSSGADTF